MDYSTGNISGICEYSETEERGIHCFVTGIVNFGMFAMHLEHFTHHTLQHHPIEKC